MSHLQMRDGRRLWYEETGSGKPVVFLHGWKASAEVYAETVRRLGDGYRCVRYDHCGHMRSDVPADGPDLGVLAEDLRELFCRLNLEKPILVGWSMGGMTVLEYLRRYGSEDLDRVVLVDIGPCKLTAPAKLAEEVALAKTDFHEFMRWYYTRRTPGFPEMSAGEQDERIRERMRGHTPSVLTALWASFSRRDHRDVLPTITCPTAIFYADIMPVCDAEAVEIFKTGIAAPTRFVCFDGCSHSLIAEDPARFTAELRDFIEL